MAEGTNTITKKKFVDVEFDPFEESTITRSNVFTPFNHGRISQIKLSVAHHKSSEKSFFRLSIKTEASGQSNNDQLRKAVQFNTIAFLADQEKIEIDSDALKTYMIDYKVDKIGDAFYDHYAGGGYVDLPVDQVLKLCEANRIEVRYTSKIGYQDLEDDTEIDIQAQFARVYADAIDDSRVFPIMNRVGQHKGRQKALDTPRIKAAKEKFLMYLITLVIFWGGVFLFNIF
jgi:hypothetical protein